MGVDAVANPPHISRAQATMWTGLTGLIKNFMMKLMNDGNGIEF